MGAMEKMFESMVTNLLTTLKITPDEIKTKVSEITNLVLTFKAQSDRMERQQLEIIRLLQIQTGDFSYGIGQETEGINGKEISRIDG